MTGHDTIVIGASAGGVEALCTLASGLPGDLPAAVFVVLHIAPSSTSVMPSILSRSGPLPARHPVNGEVVRPGMIYVAPPDHHLLLRDSQILLARGPRENGHRPAVDPLFRSAAVARGSRVVGVVLSGALDDGTAGLRAIKERGGIAIVQNPNEAMFSGMPLSAIEHADVDQVLHLRDIAPRLVELAGTDPEESELPVPSQMAMEDQIASMEEGAMEQSNRPGHVSAFTCPECNGTLFEIQDGELVRFRCRVGHAYSMESLAGYQSESAEAALWSAVVALREKEGLARRMVEYLRKRGHDLGARRFEEHAREAERRARVVQDLIERHRDQRDTMRDLAHAADNGLAPTIPEPSADQRDSDGGG